jgi:hypothetical protein
VIAAVLTLPDVSASLAGDPMVFFEASIIASHGGDAPRRQRPAEANPASSQWEWSGRLGVSPALCRIHVFKECGRSGWPTSRFAVGSHPCTTSNGFATTPAFDAAHAAGLSGANGWIDDERGAAIHVEAARRGAILRGDRRPRRAKEERARS